MNILTDMCKTADHRSIVDYHVLCSAKGTGTSLNYELDVFEEDDVKLKLIDIETKERMEQDKLMETVGPRPTEEEGEPEGGPNSVHSSHTSGTPLQSSQSYKSAPAIKGTPATDVKKPKKQPVKKDLPEAVKNKMTNSAALMAAGGTMKSWMLPGATISVPSPKIVSKVNTVVYNPISSSTTVRAGVRARTQKRITIKDALFVMESQRELKCSELFYNWWANIK